MTNKYNNLEKKIESLKQETKVNSKINKELVDNLLSLNSKINIRNKRRKSNVYKTNDNCSHIKKLSMEINKLDLEEFIKDKDQDCYNSNELFDQYENDLDEHSDIELLDKINQLPKEGKSALEISREIEQNKSQSAKILQSKPNNEYLDKDLPNKISIIRKFNIPNAKKEKTVLNDYKNALGILQIGRAHV